MQCDKAKSACGSHSRCSLSQFETSAADDSTDRVCKDHAICADNQFETQAAGAHEDRKCADHTTCGPCGKTRDVILQENQKHFEAEEEKKTEELPEDSVSDFNLSEDEDQEFNLQEEFRHCGSKMQDLLLDGEEISDELYV